MRSPCESASLMISRICFNASSTSFAGRCFCLAVMISMSSDFVMSRPSDPAEPFCGAPRTTPGSAGPAGPAGRGLLPCGLFPVAATNLLFQQVAQAGAARRRVGRAIALNGFGFLVDFLRLDGQRDGARLAIDASELGFDLLAFLQHGARVFHAIATELRGPQLAFDAVAEVDDRATR